jgi:hypothetical protein
VLALFAASIILPRGDGSTNCLQWALPPSALERRHPERVCCFQTTLVGGVLLRFVVYVPGLVLVS